MKRFLCSFVSLLLVLICFVSCTPSEKKQNDPTIAPTSEPTAEPTPEATIEPMKTGWYEENYKNYYYLEDGTMATGKYEIDGKTHYFGLDGAEIILVNPWNRKPDNFNPPLKEVKDSTYVHMMCYDDLMQMLSDCVAAGHTYNIDYAYRSFNLQMSLFTGHVNDYMKAGMTREEAEKKTAAGTAVPGTSEHELGLALDIVDKDHPGRNSAQANTDTQKWLMANSWKYGFILRYPKNKTDITGIIFEPWHYRYVGKQVAKEIFESGLCLEEYLEQLK